MTFRAERYPANWKALREGVLLRANNACEVCRVPNGETITRGVEDDAGTYQTFEGHVFDAETGEYLAQVRLSDYAGGKALRVVLTVAHLNHQESDNRLENLAALCQLHHLRHDAVDNARRRRENRVARSGQRALPGLGGGQ